MTGMKSVILTPLLALISSICCSESLLAVPVDAVPPNILFFIVDDLGWQDTSLKLHAQGPPHRDAYRTPQLQRLAAEGITFTDAYASSPVCTPTRTSVMTGRSPQQNQITYWILHEDVDTGRPREGLTPPRWNVNGLQPDDLTLPRLLQQNGYHTIHAGKAHLGAKGTAGENPENLGFDVNIGGHGAGGPADYRGQRGFAKDPANPGKSVWDIPGLEKYHGQQIYLTEALALESVAAIHDAHNKGKPFFLPFSPYAVHAPIIANQRWIDRYSKLPPKEAAYATMIETVDRALATLRKALEDLEILDDTIIIFTSDNGGLSAHARDGTAHTHNHPLNSGKGSALEGGTRVPLVIRWPGIVDEGRLTRTPVISHDHFPTILQMVGIECPPEHLVTVEGTSLVPLLIGDEQAIDPNRALFWHMPHFWGPRGPGILPFSSIRKGHWKMIYYHHPTPKRVLYHLGDDLSEKTDVASSHPEVLTAMSQLLGDHLRTVSAGMPARAGKMIPYPDRLATKEVKSDEN
ncbi:MAG TPA: sulfatase [Planctomycetes bacterium]|nr:sulfatase [Planctomycetota bacterium]